MNFKDKMECKIYINNIDLDVIIDLLIDKILDILESEECDCDFEFDEQKRSSYKDKCDKCFKQFTKYDKRI